ncbi:uncharacterized protein BDZ99DRAFT_280030 [Mytilinidion resinicola]|uniref:Uncharacterized protein n=1 Tax=Mytilinidion resinicola TaxID=574789 RepID=A0A6A6YUV5_9PEZI|nr:uncharacterized protein BDZ99DRAFT_280030 [Mytilinidion resinicola]KAF2811737.1 hypothetical protein BDZ99DRAFT_280030 [Mytilinidion resinicola]
MLILSRKRRAQEQESKRARPKRKASQELGWEGLRETLREVSAHPSWLTASQIPSLLLDDSNTITIRSKDEYQSHHRGLEHFSFCIIQVCASLTGNNFQNSVQLFSSLSPISKNR